MKKIAFATCVQLGLSCIEKIYEIGGNLDLIITLNDDTARNKSGRVYLDSIAKKNGTPLLKIKNINDDEVISTIQSMDIDWLFIIGWSQIVKKELLNTVNKGCIGIHPTLLPQGRGRAAIPWAILKGLDKTGVSMFKLDEGVDTGCILGQVEIPLTNNITATDLYSMVDDAHTVLIKNHWDDIVNDTISIRKQDENRATYWEGRKPEDGEISNSMTMLEADRMVRAVTHPYPGAFYRKQNQIIRIWSASFSCVKGDVKLSDGYMILEDFEIEE